MTSPTDTDVVELTAADTHDLRRRILRAGTPSAALDWQGDDEPDTFHLGVMRGSDLVAISTWLRAPSPDLPHVPEPAIGVQLRGMATDDRADVRGHGYGSLLLRSGLDRAASIGADHVWANARISVLGFYRAHGFDVTSNEFDSADTGVPHRRILLRLS